MEKLVDSHFSPKKMLVCQLRQIGDVVLATPSMELLKKRFPDAELHVLTEKKCATLLENNPNIHTIWALDKKKLSNLALEIAWYWKLARTGFDLVVDFQQLPRIRWVVGFSAAKVRLSYTAPWYTRPLYTHTIEPMQGYAAMAKASVLRPLGIAWQGEAPRIYLRPEELQQASDLLASIGLEPGHTLVSVDPTHRRATRRWPVAHYARLMDALAEHYPNIRFLPLWGPGEQKDIEELVALCRHKEAILHNPHMLSLREMAACIKMASLHIGNCSAPRHIAVAVGTPSCVPLGATGPAWTFPSPLHIACAAGLACQPCNKNSCSINMACLHNLQPETLLAACTSLLEQQTEPRS